jgi:hypothetical protein
MLAIFVFCFGQLALVGCRSVGSGQVTFTIENATDQEIQKVTLPRFNPMPSLTVGPIGEGATIVAAPTASFPIALPKDCKVTVDFADGTTSEIKVAVGSEIVPEFTGKLAFIVRDSDNVELIVSPN